MAQLSRRILSATSVELGPTNRSPPTGDHKPVTSQAIPLFIIFRMIPELQQVLAWPAQSKRQSLQKQWELGRPYYALTSHLWCHAFILQPMGQWWWLWSQCGATRMGLFKASNTIISVEWKGGWIAWISVLGGQVFGLEMPDLVNCISSAALSQFPVHLALVIRLKRCDEFQNCCDEKSADQVCANVIWAWSHFHGFRPRKVLVAEGQCFDLILKEFRLSWL